MTAGSGLSVIVPACNEARVIGRCLDALAVQTDPGAPFEVIVAANGCSDDTAGVARRFVGRFAARGWRCEILDLPGGGKTRAMNAGERCARHSARAFLDADVVCAPDLMAALAAALAADRPVYASGTLEIPRPRSRWSRAYARTWRRLPFAADTVVGAGLFAVNGPGRARWGDFPDTFADDLYVRLLFEPAERIEVAPRFLWPVPEGLGALVRTRRRQDRHARALLARYPRLRLNEDKSRIGPGRLLAAARTDPIGFGAYCLVVGLARTFGERRGGDYRTPREFGAVEGAAGGGS